MRRAVGALLFIAAACIRQPQPERTELPTLTTTGTTATPADLEPARLRYALESDAVWAFDAGFEVGHGLFVTASLDADEAFVERLTAAGVDDTDALIDLDGVAHTVMLEGGELVDAFTPERGTITGRVGEVELDRSFTADEIDTLATRQADPSFPVDELGRLTSGPTDAPSAFGIAQSGLAPLFVLGPPLSDQIVQVGDQWLNEMAGPLGSTLEVSVAVTGTELIEDAAAFVLEVEATVPAGQPMPIDLAAGNALLPGTRDVTILDRLAGLAAGTVRLDELSVSGQARFDPSRGLTVDSEFTASLTVTYLLAEGDGGGELEAVETVEVESRRTLTGADPDQREVVLDRLRPDLVSLAFRPLAAVAPLGLADLESERIDALLFPFQEIRGDIFPSLIPAQIVQEGVDPVPVISLLVGGEVRGDPLLAAGVGQALIGEGGEPVEAFVGGRTVYRIQLNGETWTLWSLPTHLFVVVGDPAVADPILERLMAAAPPYRWQPGDCLDFPSPDTGVPFAPFGELDLSHCDAAHTHEVIHTEVIPDGPDVPYPGDEVMLDRVDLLCGERFSTYVGGLDRDTAVELITYLPNADEWAQGARYFGCMVYLGGAEAVQVIEGRLEGAGPENPSQPAKGDCLSGDVVVACEVSHQAEVIGSAVHPGQSSDPFPGRPAIDAFGEDACAEALTEYGMAEGDLDVQGVGRGINAYEWSTGLRDFLCLAVAMDEDGFQVDVVGPFSGAWEPAA